MKNNRTNNIVLFFIVFFLFIIHCSYYYPFFADDSLISLRYVQRFIEGKGLTWNDGENVEGYSNFLWVIAISVLGKAGVDLIVATRLLGLFCATLIIGFIILLTRKSKLSSKWIGLIFLVGTASFPIWTIGGLEQPFVILLLLINIISVFRMIDLPLDRKFIVTLALSNALLAINRPDGILFTAISVFFLAYSYYLSNNLRFLRNLLLPTILPIIFYLGLLGFRYSYYGELVPNTALIKAKFSLHHLKGGFFYLVKFIISTNIFFLLAVYLLYKMIFIKKDVKMLYLGIIAVAWTLYIISVGGDIFPGFRHLEILVLIISLILIKGLDDGIIKFNFIKSRISKWIFINLLLISYIVFQSFLGYNHAAKKERWEFTGMEAGTILKNSFPEKTLVGVTEAGSIPYTSQLPTIDMLGLNDHYLPRHPPKNFGNGMLAHELGDANYILNIRKPDILLFNMGANGSMYHFAHQMFESEKFQNTYIAVCLSYPNTDYPFTIFLNKYGENIGIVYDEHLIKIPYYLISKNSGLTVRDLKIRPSILKSEKITLKNPRNKKWKLIENQNYKGEITYNPELITLEITPSRETLASDLVLIEDLSSK